MYLYVYDEGLYNSLIAQGKKLLYHTIDINGVPIWVFASDGTEKFDLDGGGYYRSSELHIAL